MSHKLTSLSPYTGTACRLYPVYRNIRTDSSVPARIVVSLPERHIHRSYSLPLSVLFTFLTDRQTALTALISFGSKEAARRTPSSCPQDTIRYPLFLCQTASYFSENNRTPSIIKVLSPYRPKFPKQDNLCPFRLIAAIYPLFFGNFIICRIRD